MALPWCKADLVRLKIAQRRGATPTEMALRAQHSAADVDIALWAMLGRTPSQALAVLNRPYWNS